MATGLSVHISAALKPAAGRLTGDETGDRLDETWVCGAGPGEV